MEHIGTIISGQHPQTISAPPRSLVTGTWQQHLSVRQRSDADAFLQTFPTLDRVYEFFAPSMWAYALQHQSECMNYPCITLRMVDAVYGSDGAALAVVKNQFVGVYQLSTAKDQYNANSVSMAAGLFISKYGHECTLYAMMLYFGNYLTEYKSSFAQYDVQDVLQQFGKKFLPWWRSRRERDRGDAAGSVRQAPPGVPVGNEAKRIYLRRCVREGTDIRQGGLYRMGYVSDADIVVAEREVKEGII